MKIYVCVDDTDDLTKDISTGKIAEYLANIVKERGGIPSGITRHQLLLHPDVPYTSHNSSMAFYAEIGNIELDSLIVEMEQLVVKYSKPEAAPGLAVCVQQERKQLESLLAFSFKVKNEVLVKDMAYEVAKATNIYLAELGGTGQGVIGALAGIGLRMSGMDGTFRGQTKLHPGTYSVSELMAHKGVDFVCTVDRKMLNPEELVVVDKNMKLYLWNHQSVLVVQQLDGRYYHHGKHKSALLKDTVVEECGYFTEDNDTNECTGDTYFSCLNCLYRRNTSEGIECTHKDG